MLRELINALKPASGRRRSRAIYQVSGTDPLEPRLLLSGADLLRSIGSGYIDAYDSLELPTEQLSFLRKNGEWTFLTEEPSNIILHGENATLTELEPGVFHGVASAGFTTLQGVEIQPVLVADESGLRRFPTGEVIVNYGGNNAEEFFLRMDAVNFEESFVHSDGAQYLVDFNSQDTLEVVNSLYEHDEVIWAEPNFVQEVRQSFVPDDFFFASDQWALRARA